MFCFGNHTFDPDTGELDGPREAMRLQPKPARLLAMLLEAGGELVERDSIRAALWPDTNVDFEAGLNTCVRQIRTALRDSGDDTEIIETLPKRGYRVAVAVERGNRQAQPLADAASGGAAASNGETPLTGSAALPYVLVFLLLAVGVALVIWNQMFAAGAAGRGAPAAVAGNAAAPNTAAGDTAAAASRLAVLPFVDPDAGGATPYNSELTDAFVAALVAAAPSEIIVVGPRTTAPLAMQGATPADIAASVAADFVLHGGYRAGAGAFFVELVLPDGGHLFARRIEQWDASVTAAPPELVAAIATSIREARGR